MMLRNLTIEFLEDCTVKYQFSRSGYPNKISRYLIEHPANRVRINKGSNVETPDSRKKITDDGSLLLLWEKTPESDLTEDARVIEYEKQGFLVVLQQTPRLLGYKERIRIKATEGKSCFHLYLHGPNRRISALKARSTAVFRAASGGYIHSCNAFIYSGHSMCSEHKVSEGTGIYLKPVELADAKFYCGGLLDVNWVLEIDESTEQ